MTPGAIILPSGREYGHVGVLRTLSNIPVASSSWDCQKLAAEQLLGTAGEIISHGRRYGPTSNHRPPPSHPSRQGRTPCWVNSLRSKASVVVPM